MPPAPLSSPCPSDRRVIEVPLLELWSLFVSPLGSGETLAQRQPPDAILTWNQLPLIGSLVPAWHPCLS